MFALLLLAAHASVCAGCLYTAGRTTRETGPQITRESLTVIEPGRTTLDWLVAAFGEPVSRVRVADGSEIVRYDCDIRTSEGSYIFMLIATSSNTIERTSWWFEVRDGVVTRYFGEQCPPVEIGALDPPPAPPSAVPANWSANGAQP